jgi:hypothetical protein
MSKGYWKVYYFDKVNGGDYFINTFDDERIYSLRFVEENNGLGTIRLQTEVEVEVVSKTWYGRKVKSSYKESKSLFVINREDFIKAEWVE